MPTNNSKELRAVECGLDTNELDLIRRALISYSRELENTKETCKKLIQRAIDARNNKRVEILRKILHRTFIERLNADGIEFELDANPGEVIGRIVMIDVDQSKIK